MAFLLGVVVILALAPLALRAAVNWRYADDVYTQVEETPPQPAAIVFGAGCSAFGAGAAVFFSAGFDRLKSRKS